MDHQEHAVANVEAENEDIGTNLSGNPHISEMIEARLTRRQALQGGLSATAAAVFGTGAGVALSACSDDDDDGGSSGPKLGFTAVAKNKNDAVTLPPGYTASVLWAMGDSFAAADPAWADNGSETAESYNRRCGDHNDGLYYFGVTAAGAPAPASSDRGLLCINHEALNPFGTTTGAPNGLYLHPAGGSFSVVGGVATRTNADEVRKEVLTHGVSVIEIAKSGATWAVVKDSPRNRRITGATEMNIQGPLRGNDALKTKFSPDATRTQGTINNCASGFTPWGTYLTCEENWVGYFSRAAGDNAKRTRTGEVASLARYGSPEGALQRGNWDTVANTDEFKRWDTSVRGVSSDGTDDFRNVVNQFGFIVEIDPYNPVSTPAKHTGLGRFAHEGCWPAPVVAGKPVVFYMGDDNRGDYIYKYVSTANWDPADANAADRMATGAKYLDSGKLYVAKFNANGSGEWLELTGTAAYLDTRIAADAKGATRMDRPEWGAVNPQTREVYMTLTNSNAANRITTGTPTGNAALTDAANPRGTNANGHIIRWREAGDDSAATLFQWDIYLFAAPETADPASVNISQLTADNDLSSPDGLWFARSSSDAAGLLWIETDDSAYTNVTNCMLLAAVPGNVGDGGDMAITSGGRQVVSKVGKVPTTTTLRRFLVGPKECEITGLDSTPDGKALFVSIQHPGENTNPNFADPASFGSHWPDGGPKRPRSATIVITRTDGGVVGL